VSAFLAGHERVRIGPNEWASIKTAKGHVLMVPHNLSREAKRKAKRYDKKTRWLVQHTTQEECQLFLTLRKSNVPRHSLNAAIALYTMTVGALVNSCVDQLDYSWNKHGVVSNVNPDIKLTSSEDLLILIVLAIFGIVGIAFYAILLPTSLFKQMHKRGPEGRQRHDTIESHVSQHDFAVLAAS
jgi:hypothetical protein